MELIIDGNPGILVRDFVDECFYPGCPHYPELGLTFPKSMLE